MKIFPCSFQKFYVTIQQDLFFVKNFFTKTNRPLGEEEEKMQFFLLPISMLNSYNFIGAANVGTPGKFVKSCRVFIHQKNLRLDNLLLKMAMLGWRLSGYIRLFPVRVLRIWRHFKWGAARLSGRKGYPPDLAPWWAGAIFHALDVLGVPEIYETAIDLAKWRTRPLTPHEMAVARSVFGEAIPLERVRVDESAHIGCRHYYVVYVSFFTINAWGKFSRPILIHELVHVWQYLQMGSVYIPRALYAQRTAEGYDYGGVEALRECVRQGGSLASFNLEQQADIVSDYFRIREGILPRWGRATVADLPVYEHFVNEIRGSTIPAQPT